MICRHFGVCGGCTAQDVSYSRQLDQKAESIKVRLARFIARPADVLAVPLVLPTPVGRSGLDARDAQPWRFRRKVAFAFGTRPCGRGLVMGHYARGSRQIVPVDECPVHSDRGNRIAFALRDHLVRTGITAADRAGRGVLRHVLIRSTADDAQAVAMLVVTRNDRALRPAIRALLDSTDRPEGFLLNIHDRPGPYMVGPTTLRIAGREHVEERLHGARFLVSPGAFFQTNPQAAGALQGLVTAGVGASRRVLDLYAGSGLFTVPLALGGAHVMAVEENRQSVRDATRNVRLNRLPSGRVRLTCARVEDALLPAVREPWDAVVLDPPRQGCSPTVRSGIFERIAAPIVVYVSCNLDALAAELPSITRAGYRIARLQAVDMFPHTDHIETVIQLRRTPPILTL